jgi:release factor glutamine methyltransferase
MTCRHALQEGVRLLEGTDTPFLDASILLAHAAGWTREKLLASYPDTLDTASEEKFFQLLKQRLTGEPVAYLVGFKEFYGRPFLVDRRVLTPRPDTETLVEAGLKAAAALRTEGNSGSLKFADVCTGSGCVALTMALEDPGIVMTASDLSEEAAEVFAANRAALCPDESEASRRINFRLGDLLSGDPESYHVILSNPPYLTSDEVEEMKSRRWPEPALALEGGFDGLDLVRKLIGQSRDRLEKNGYLIMEAATAQMPAIEELLEQHGFGEIRIFPDLAGRDRVIEGRTGGA